MSVDLGLSGLRKRSLGAFFAPSHASSGLRCRVQRSGQSEPGICRAQRGGRTNAHTHTRTHAHTHTHSTSSESKGKKHIALVAANTRTVSPWCGETLDTEIMALLGISKTTYAATQAERWSQETAKPTAGNCMRRVREERTTFPLLLAFLPLRLPESCVGRQLKLDCMTRLGSSASSSSRELRATASASSTS